MRREFRWGKQRSKATSYRSAVELQVIAWAVRFCRCVVYNNTSISVNRERLKGQ